jgi:hypothetical protein
MGFDQRRLDPTPDVVARLLLLAKWSANRGLQQRQLGHDLGFWRRVARAVARQPEGWRSWRGGRGGVPAAEVHLAWWTDHIGRRHYRVQGRRYWGLDPEPPPPFADLPLCHLYPQRVLLRRVAGREEPLVLCGCGACGSPSAVGWTGECCGPCHDRREEAERPLEQGIPLTLRWPARNLFSLAYTADGRLIAAASNRVHVWEPSGEATAVPLPSDWRGTGPLAIAPDGKVALAGTRGRLLLLDPADGSTRQVMLPRASLASLRFSPDGRRLVLVGSPSYVLDVAAGVSPLPADLPLWVAAFSPDGHTLYGAGWDLQVTAIDLRSGDVAPLEPLAPELGYNGSYEPPFDRLECFPDGRRLVALAGWELGGELRILDLPTETWHEWPQGSRPSPETSTAALAFSPDGRFLTAATCEGHLRFWDVASGREHGALHLPLGSRSWCMRMSFAPDGQTLAVADGIGIIKLWPWRRLLEAP